MNMKWNNAIAPLEVLSRGGGTNPVITDIVHDSRNVKPGAIFVAVPGFTDQGDLYIADAVSRGAAAVVSEHEQSESGVPWVQVTNSRKALAILAKHLWNIQFDSYITVGITGTNGKTTIAGMYHRLFQNIFGREYSWLFSTITYTLGSRTQQAHHTTPEASDLLRFINTADKKPKAITMEVSSHALELYRVEGFTFDLAVWTNLSQDHLDFHKTMEAYYQAKKKLFIHNLKSEGAAIINTDDTWGARLSKELSDVRQVTYGCAESTDVHIVKSDSTWSGTEITIKYKKKEMHFRSSLCGFFNVYNMTALVAGALVRNITEKDIQKCFDGVRLIPGRMERVPVFSDFSVIVDYAHTPDALENVLSTAEKLTEGRLFCVFGCGGDRDRKKRPLMAQVVARICDEAVVTSDNPRTEEPLKIIDEIKEGMPLDFPCHIIPDRREAIKKALTVSRRGDCVVIAGKGHENYQEINGVRHHFDDREVVVELSKEMGCCSEQE